VMYLAQERIGVVISTSRYVYDRPYTCLRNLMSLPWIRYVDLTTVLTFG
jgi:hypothetical protein